MNPCEAIRIYGEKNVSPGVIAACRQGPLAPTDVPVTRDNWSIAAKTIAKLATPEDKGIGDTLERLLRGKGGNLYKRWFKRIVGRECGCGDRQQALNVAYPYAAT